jgi:hypothetical protein
MVAKADVSEVSESLYMDCPLSRLRPLARTEIWSGGLPRAESLTLEVDEVKDL